MFIFDNCRCSGAVKIPVQYEPQSTEVADNFPKAKISQTEGLNERSFSDPNHRSAAFKDTRCPGEHKLTGRVSVWSSGDF